MLAARASRERAHAEELPGSSTTLTTLFVRKRLDERARAWGVDLDDVLETETSVVGFGRRGTQAVAIKVLNQPGDEWRSGEVLQAFAGHGVVRLYEQAAGALLLERLDPGRPLAALVLEGKDDEATG